MKTILKLDEILAKFDRVIEPALSSRRAFLSAPSNRLMFPTFAPSSPVTAPTVTASSSFSTETHTPISFTSVTNTISFPLPASRRTLPTSISTPTILRRSSNPETDTPLFKKITVSLITGSALLIGIGCSRRPTPALALLPPIHKASETETIEETRKREESGDVEILWERYVKQNPKDVNALKILIYEKMRKGKNGEAVKYVERLIELERDEVEWRLLEALCYEMLGDYNVAKELFKDILKEKPLLVKALHGLASVMHKNNEGPAVYEMLNEALELARQGKKVTEARNISIVIAQMHVIKGDLEEGLEKFQGLIDENPRDFRPYLCQGIILTLLDRKEEAQQQLMTYHALVPEEFPQKRFLDDIVLEAMTKSL